MVTVRTPARAVATDNRLPLRACLFFSSSLFPAVPSARRRSLSPQTELRDERSVPLDVVPSEVVEQPAPATHEHEQSPARVMVLGVDLQVVGEVVDALGEQRHLHLR